MCIRDSNEATDQETKLRLQGQLAILDNNEALAKKILAEMQAAEAAKKFAESFQFALNSVMSMTARINAFIASVGGAKLSPSMTTPTGAAEVLGYGQKMSDLSQGTLGGSIFDPSFARRGESQDLRITVDTAQSGDRFAALIAESIQIATKSGISYGVAGGL